MMPSVSQNPWPVTPGRTLETPQQHVAFVLDLKNDAICHVFMDPRQGLFVAPLVSPPDMLVHAARLARNFPLKEGDSLLRDLAPFAAPFLRAFNDGMEAVRYQEEREAWDRAEQLTLATFKEAEELATTLEKKKALDWLSKKKSEMMKERKAKKSAIDAAASVKTAGTKKAIMGLKGAKKSVKDSDAVSVMTTTSFFAKDGDWCKTKKDSGTGTVKRLTQTFFFSFKRPSSKTPPTDIRAEYLARSPSTTTAPVAATSNTTVVSSTSRDPSSLSIPANARETIVSGVDWSRGDNWDDSTVEAMLLNERFNDNTVLSGPIFE